MEISLDPPAVARPVIDGMTLLAHLPTAMAVIDAGGVIAWVNRTTEEVFGYPPGELVGTNMLDHFDLERNPMALESIAFALEHPGRRLPMMYEIVNALGHPIIVEVIANNQLANPDVAGLVVQFRICEEQRVLDQILESLGTGEPLGNTMGLLADAATEQTLESSAAVYAMHPDGERMELLAASPMARIVASAALADERATPWAETAATGREAIVTDTAELDPDLRHAAEGVGFRACWTAPVHRQGSTDLIGVLVFWRTEPGGPEPTAKIMMNRLTQLAALGMTRAEDERLLLHAARHDALTGLPNREQFFGAVEQAVTVGPGRAGVLYVDLDGFKQVNDRHGHAYGDLVLTTIADRLRATLRAGDMAARLGGDEFAILCPGASDDDLGDIAARIVRAARQPIDTPMGPLQVGASVGVATAEPGTATGDVLVDRADTALLAVKASTKGTWRFHP